MTSPDDVWDEMRVLRLDETTADRLLAGVVAPDDAPPGYAEVARLVHAMSAEPTERELARQGDALRRVQQVVRSDRSRESLQPSGRLPMKHRARAKLVGIVVAGTILGTSGLAMAGALPGPAQDALSRVLSKVGVSVPASQPDVTHPASSGSDISRIATTTDATGAAKGQLISSTASGGMSQAGQHGSPAGSAGSSSAPVTVPNSGGTGTGDTASRGSADTGTSTADTSSQGHSTDGSGNAAGRPVPSP